jgi:hypothetical protein
VTTATTIATPPSTGVGLGCPDSWLGGATMLKREANALIAGVRARVKPKAVPAEMASFSAIAVTAMIQPLVFYSFIGKIRQR